MKTTLYAENEEVHVLWTGRSCAESQAFGDRDTKRQQQYFGNNRARTVTKIKIDIWAANSCDPVLMTEEQVRALIQAQAQNQTFTPTTQPNSEYWVKKEHQCMRVSEGDSDGYCPYNSNASSCAQAHANYSNWKSTLKNNDPCTQCGPGAPTNTNRVTATTIDKGSCS